MPFVTKDGGHGGSYLQKDWGQSKNMGPLAHDYFHRMVHGVTYEKIHQYDTEITLHYCYIIDVRNNVVLNKIKPRCSRIDSKHI